MMETGFINRRQALGAGLGLTIWMAGGERSGAQDRPIARIGFIGGGQPSDSAMSLDALRQGLRALGYIEPGTLRIETRFAGGDLGRIPALIGELEQSGVKVLVAHAQATFPSVTAARRLPLVFTLSADPVSSGITAELSRPQRDATGVTLMAAELNLKRLELLREISPVLRRVAVIYTPQHAGEHLERAWVDRAGSVYGFEPKYYPASTRQGLDDQLSALRTWTPEAIVLLSDGFMLTHRRAIMDFAISARAPVMAGWRVFAEAGALASYGPRLDEMARRPAYFIDRILRGTKAAELPIERPTALELVINMDTAGKLGISLPTAVIARADRVIG